LDKDYPALSSGCSENKYKLPFEEFLQSTYAQAVAPRSTKRTTSDRQYLSPVDIQPKRSALSGLIKTPTELKAESRFPGRDGVVTSTPKEVTSEVLPMEEDSCTPNNDRYLEPKCGCLQTMSFHFYLLFSSSPSLLHSCKVRVAVQRRLFAAPPKENAPPPTR